MNTKYIFWQNMLSIHQAPFLEELANDAKVVLVVERMFEQVRSKSGWDIPDAKSFEVMCAPSVDQMRSLIKDNLQAVHVFSGFSAYPMVSAAFSFAYGKVKRLYVYAEPFDKSGWKGWLRSLKYRYYALRYSTHLAGILATGDMGVNSYRTAGFPKNIISEWGYFTKQENYDTVDNVVEKKKPILLFVGELCNRKNILKLLDALIPLSGQFEHCYIVGDGELRRDVEMRLRKKSNMSILGAIENNEVQKLMRESDLLILPSVFDGWGAVVNEALWAGCRVLVSSRCGASALIRNNLLGSVFYETDICSLTRAINNEVKMGALTKQQRYEVHKWAERCISPSVAVSYFKMIMNNQQVLAPWKI